MIYLFKKGLKQSVGKAIFSTADFDCRCLYPECEMTRIDENLIAGLEELSETIGHFIFDRGFSCPRHNLEVGGLADSQHLLGKAADIRSPDYSPYGIARIAEGIAVFANGGQGIYNLFTHLDVRNGKARWDYSKGC